MALSAASQAQSGEQAYSHIQRMVNKLDDPYTRIVPARCPSHLGIRHLLHCPGAWPCTHVDVSQWMGRCVNLAQIAAEDLIFLQSYVWELPARQ